MTILQLSATVLIFSFFQTAPVRQAGNQCIHVPLDVQELAMSIKRGMLLPQDNDSAGDHDDGGFQPPEPSTENAGNSVAQALHEEQVMRGMLITDCFR